MESDEMIPIETKYEGEDIDLEDELDEVAELPPPKKAKTKSKSKTSNKDNKRRRTSHVWSFFELLPTKDEEKPTCKCKKCGKEYIATGAYCTGNLERHLGVCPRKDTRDVGQLILGQNATSVSSPKFDPAKFRELLCAAITINDIPFRFVEYVVVLDPRYKLPFIDWCYQKLYGYASSLQYLKVREKLFAMFGEYVSNVPTPSTSSGMACQATQEIEEQYANEGSLSMMQEFDSFHSMDVELAQSQLEELTEDIMNMNINKDEHKEDTSSMEPSMDPVP
ncbi:hypothetical protein SO802_029356 [Lithocarpus litseifolius]|uniref:BED-type domain-containing protein n=1 Tax=Lithocarpus litseifolius TaxID=425828 RepID=A0AAW2BVG6_9ROSI